MGSSMEAATCLSSLTYEPGHVLPLFRLKLEKLLTQGASPVSELTSYGFFIVDKFDYRQVQKSISATFDECYVR